jgi:adenylate cyclase
MAFPSRHTIYRFGAFVLDPASEALLTAEGERIPLRAKSFALLLLMVENAGRLLARDAIMEALWPNIFVTDDNVTQCVRDVRGALGREACHLLRTIRRRGYIFEAGAVRREPAPSIEVVDLRAFRVGKPAFFPGRTSSAGEEVARAPGSTGARVRSSTERPVRLSVLVLPLRSLDCSDAHERLAESILGDIVTDLARYLKTLAPGEAQVLFHDDWLGHWRTSPQDYPADYVLRGSVQGKRGTSVNLQLIDRASGVCIWAERCDLHGQRGVVRLMHEISIVLVRDVGRRIDALAADLTARDLLMRGRAWLLRPASASNRQALACFERAIAMETDSVGAKLGIATVLVGDLSNGWSQAIEQDEARAEALLWDVFQAGTDVAISHGVNGTLRRLQGRLDESRAELEMAMEFAPHYAMAASQLGMTLVYCGLPEAALPYLERSVRMVPHDPQTPLLLSNLGTCRLLLGDVDTAIDRLRKAAAGNPQHFGPPLMLAAALGLKSASPEASATLRRAVELCPAFGTLSGLRNWVRRQAGPGFVSIYEHMVERGLQRAGMSEERSAPSGDPARLHSPRVMTSHR